LLFLLVEKKVEKSGVVTPFAQCEGGRAPSEDAKKNPGKAWNLRQKRRSGDHPEKGKGRRRQIELPSCTNRREKKIAVLKETRGANFQRRGKGKGKTPYF